MSRPDLTNYNNNSNSNSNSNTMDSSRSLSPHQQRQQMHHRLYLALSANHSHSTRNRDPELFQAEASSFHFSSSSSSSSSESDLSSLSDLDLLHSNGHEHGGRGGGRGAEARGGIDMLIDQDDGRDDYDDFSDYEMPLGGRWDLAAHWYLSSSSSGSVAIVNEGGDYSEGGVEGDADDDDDNYNGTDEYSEGLPSNGIRGRQRQQPQPQPQPPQLPHHVQRQQQQQQQQQILQQQRRQRQRLMNLDLRRVQEILGSSPSSTPIVLTGGVTGGLLSRLSSSSSISSSSSLPATTGQNGSISAESRHHPLLEAGAITPPVVERTVRFSHDDGTSHGEQSNQNRQEQPSFAQSGQSRNMSSDNATVLHDSGSDTDISNGLGSTGSSIGDTNNGRQSRIESAPQSEVLDHNNMSSPAMDLNRLYLHSPRIPSIRNTSHISPRATSPFWNLDPERRHTQLSTHHSLQPQPHSSSTVVLSSTMMSRRDPPLTSAQSFFTTFPAFPSTASSSSSASSRMESPIPRASSSSSSFVHPPSTHIPAGQYHDDKDEEDRQGEGVSLQERSQKRRADGGHERRAPTSTSSSSSSMLLPAGGPRTGVGAGTAAEMDRSRRAVVSSTISSLPSFASTVFMPRIHGSGNSSNSTGGSPIVGTGDMGYNDEDDPAMGDKDVKGSSGVYVDRAMRSNHPRRPCCFLQPGQRFKGTQNLRTQMATLSGLQSRQTEEWDVKVTINAVDYEAGVLYGLMEAMDVPMSASSVVTFWEGEIVDFENHTFWTQKWATKAKTDLDHWKRLEAFQGVDEKYIAKGAKTGRFRGHIDQKYIFMRWKEKHFVNISEHTSGLTIAGFYYVSMRRSDGYVEGYYHDHQSTPFQHLCLSPVFDQGGYSSSIFEVA